MDPTGLEALNAAVGAVLTALARIAPQPPPRPVRLWIRPSPSTALPVVISVRSGPIRINASMDLSTSLEIADRILKARGAYAAGFSANEQDALREAFSGLASAVPGGKSGIAAPRLSFGQRIATRCRECPRPVTAAIWSEAGTVEVDVAAPGLAGGKEESVVTGMSALQG